MEQQKPDNATLSITGKLPVVDKNAPRPAAAAAAKKKRRGAMQMIKVALFMLRRRSGKSKSADVVASNNGMWNRLVGSMRPLHLQSNDSPRHSTNSNSIHHPKQQNHDVINLTSKQQQQQPMSPAGSSASYSSSSREDGMSRYASVGNLTELESRYASAVNLRELDDEDDEESDYEYDENGGDEMIDVKAEEFIAQFYAQMRLQRMNSVDRRYREMIERSIS